MMLGLSANAIPHAHMAQVESIHSPSAKARADSVWSNPLQGG